MAAPNHCRDCKHWQPDETAREGDCHLRPRQFLPMMPEGRQWAYPVQQADDDACEGFKEAPNL